MDEAAGGGQRISDFLLCDCDVRRRTQTSHRNQISKTHVVPFFLGGGGVERAIKIVCPQKLAPPWSLTRGREERKERRNGFKDSENPNNKVKNLEIGDI